LPEVTKYFPGSAKKVFDLLKLLGVYKLMLHNMMFAGDEKHFTRRLRCVAGNKKHHLSPCPLGQSTMFSLIPPIRGPVTTHK